MSWELLIKMTKKELSMQGRKNRQAGAYFERRVRADLQKKDWIVDRWTNNVRLDEEYCGIVPAKTNRFNMRNTGFPDFIAFHHVFWNKHKDIVDEILKFTSFPYISDGKIGDLKNVIGVECKSGKYLDKIEKEKCKWLLQNNIFSKILIASKGKKRGEIVYKEFE